MSHPAHQSTSEAAGTLGGYEFRNLSDIRQFTRATPESLADMAAGYAAVAQQLADTPAAPIAESYAQIAAGLSALAQASGEISPQLEAYHAADFERIDNPRPGEPMADYGQNAAG